MRETSTGETAAFVSNVVLDGAVENWLVELEDAMKKSMQHWLFQSSSPWQRQGKMDHGRARAVAHNHGLIQWIMIVQGTGQHLEWKKRTETTQGKAGSLFI